MALLGIFSAAEASGATSATSGSRTSAAGSLVVAAGGAWASGGTTIALSSSLAGTYTEAREVAVTADASYALAYNIGGTRGASHTLTNTIGTTSGVTVSGAEFDSVHASAEVTVGSTASGTSTAPSCSVTVPAGGNATVVAVMAYDGASTTIAVSNGTEATEADENNDAQAHAMAYKVSQSAGVVTIAWTLGASRAWSCYAVAFSDPGGGSNQPPRSMHQYRQRR